MIVTDVRLSSSCIELSRSSPSSLISQDSVITRTYRSGDFQDVEHVRTVDARPVEQSYLHLGCEQTKPMNQRRVG